MADVSIHAGEQPIHKVFSDEFVFTVPRYQRPYLWEPEQADQLLDDLLDALREDEEPIDSLEPYFLGSEALLDIQREQYQSMAQADEVNRLFSLGSRAQQPGRQEVR